MASKRKQPSKERNLRQIRARNSAGEDPALMLAQTVLRPSVQGATTLGEYNKSLQELDLTGLMDALGAQIKAINDGDLSRAEAMLTTQAHTLDAVFNNLAGRAINAKYMNNLECYLKLALRAQSQCRAT